MNLQEKRLKVWNQSKLKLLSMIFPKRIAIDLFAGFTFPEIGSDRLGLFIYGEVGSGKTLLACHLLEKILVKDFIDDRFNPSRYKFITVPELLLEIRDSFSGRTKTEKEVVEFYSTVNYLILDDLGVEKVTDWSLQTLYLIINRRYENMKSTIVTSNYSLNELSEKMHDRRIPSRLMAMCKVVKLTGKDRRRR